MAPPADRIFGLASALLDAIGAHFASVGVALPARQFVANSPTVVHDCEQLAVAVERVYAVDGDTVVEVTQTSPPRASFAMRAATMSIHLVRCVPVMKDGPPRPPSGDEITGSAQTILRDAQLLTNAVTAAVRDGSLPGCGTVAPLEWAPITASGGMGGGVYRVRLGLSIGA